MTDKQTFTRDCICSEAYDVGPEMCRAKEHRATHADATLNDSKPKSFRELAREMRDEARMCREKDYMASSIALDEQAARIEELADEWEQYSQNEWFHAGQYIATQMLGAKERR